MLERYVEGDVAIWTMAHGKANALDIDLVGALSEAAGAEVGQPTRAVVLTGNGPIFSAGVDLFQVLEGGRKYLERFLPAFDQALRRLVAFPRPLVAAINGHAVAGGCILASCSDYRVMTTGRVSFGVPELTVGVPFPPLALAILKSVWSAASLREAFYRGSLLNGQESLDRHLVDELCAPGEHVRAALVAASRLATIPARTFALHKRFLRADVLETPEDRAALDALVEVWASPEVAASIRAYVERTLGRRAGA